MLEKQSQKLRFSFFKNNSTFYKNTLTATGVICQKLQPILLASKFTQVFGMEGHLTSKHMKIIVSLVQNPMQMEPL